MKAPIKNMELAQVLEDLKTSDHLNFDEICDLLFRFSYNDFDEIFNISDKVIPDETYVQIPVYNGRFVAVLMVWGIDGSSAIHDHSKYDVRIKVLKGMVTEVIYRENENFIEYDGVGTALENHVFPEEYNGIHSIVNNSEDISVSLHVYRTPRFDLKGVRIFDTENRKIGWLTENATSCSWNLPPSAYQKIQKI